ncbi:MAG: cellulase, partial [Naasia sp.]|nr:cellulase [Naasia sp.]
RSTGKPLVTTECWSIVDYKDWPGLDWGWVKELNERAVTRAAATGRWIGLATSNFCSPQFRGVWRDIDYHRRLTDLITSAPVDDDLATPAKGPAHD